jgi:hypothetical protein
MNYFITRDGQQYGPYSLADLQRYVASGDILLTDLVRNEGMSEPLPVSQVIGTIPVPQAAAAAGPVAVGNFYPDPPNLHWALVLLFGVISCGLFLYAWDLVQAAWMKKISPQSRAIYYYAICAGLLLVIVSWSTAVSAVYGRHHASPAAALLPLCNLLNFVIRQFGKFSLKASLEEHFTTEEPMGLLLNGIMTFFFGGIYFQYHLNDIVRRKNFDRLDVMRG